MDITPYMPYIYGILAGLVYAASAYFKSVPVEKFDFKKLASTLMTALIVVFGLIQTGIPVSQETMEAQLAVYGMLTILIDNMLNAIFRRVTPATKAATVAINGIEFTVSPENPRVGERVTFIDIMHNIETISFGDGAIWKWTAGDVPYIATHTYTVAGKYTVTASAKVNGVMQAASTTVTVTSGSGPQPTPDTKKGWLQVFLDWLKSIFGWK